MTIPEFQRCKRDKKKLIVVTAYDALFARHGRAGRHRSDTGRRFTGRGRAGEGQYLVGHNGRHALSHEACGRGCATSRSSSAICPSCPIKPAKRTPCAMPVGFFRRGHMRSNWRAAAAMADRVQAMTEVGIPVFGHLGMTPQSVNQYGRVQGAGEERRPGTNTRLRCQGARGSRCGGHCA